MLLRYGLPHLCEAASFEQAELRLDSTYLSLLTIKGAKMSRSPGDTAALEAQEINFPLLKSCLTLRLDLYLDLHFNED